MKNKVIFICGSTGSGKTTYSQKLSKDLSALHFSIDELMKTLFWMDAPKTQDYNWAIERVERCEKLIMNLSIQAVNLGQSVILDLGFSEPNQRNKFYDWAKQNKIPYELHYLDIPAQTRWDRVQKRNEKLDDKSIAITQEIFDWMENYFQAPLDSEVHVHIKK